MKAKQSVIQIDHIFQISINNKRLWIKKKSILLNLINHQPDIDKIYLYAKDVFEAKCQ